MKNNADFTHTHPPLGADLTPPPPSPQARGAEGGSGGAEPAPRRGEAEPPPAGRGRGAGGRGRGGEAVGGTYFADAALEQGLGREDALPDGRELHVYAAARSAGAAPAQPRP